MSIKFENVSIKKQDKEILCRINFDIRQGESWVILGENGSGKTTLLSAIAGREIPAKGKILRQKILKIELVANTFSNNRLVREAYQYYQQRYNSDDTEGTPSVFEVIQNQVKPLHTADENSVQLPPPKYDNIELEKYANLLKINHLLPHKIVTLSNGETRRVHILNALLKKPDLLLLDNPFMGLDIESRETLHDILKEIKKTGVAIILVCNEHEIPDDISNILVLKNGKIDKILSKNLPLEKEVKEILKQNVLYKKSKIKSELIEAIKKETPLNDFQYAVRFRNVTIEYDHEKVVNNISWDIKKGEKWALIGPNGSGKSTILSLILGDNPQAYGNDYDLFDRKRGTGESIWDIKKRIGYVSPELQLYSNAYKKVWKTIASGLFDTADLYKNLNENQKENLINYLKLFDLYESKDKMLSELSTGQQRSVFLARALIKNPPLLILDEPCQGLDNKHMVHFRELVNDLAVSLDKTLIYVTHYNEEIPACVNQVFNIEKGKRVFS